MMCELQRHVRRAVENNGAIRPAAILQKLKSKNDSPGVALYRGHFVTSAIYVWDILSSYHENHNPNAIYGLCLLH